MNDTEGSKAQEDRTPPGRWLLFIHHLPPKPDYLRVKVRRRLQKLGAVLVKSSVYALPASEDALEDFQWLRREIVDEGGEAVVCEALLLAGLDDGELREMVRADRDLRYAEIAAEARAQLLGRSAGDDGRRTDLEALHARLRRRLDEVVAIDFFEAPGRADAEHALRAIQARLNGEEGMESTTEAPQARIRPGTVWVTRRGVKVDRIASAWLIRRFIDPAATFRFTAPDAPPAPGEVRFDMFEGEYTHEADRCTFETLLLRFGLDGNPGLRVLGEVVHDIDCKDGKFGRAETPGVAALVQGIVAAHNSDEARIETGMTMLDGLYAAFRGEPR
ncbi:MAG TPA: chromate resistance protein ChrB domain-containing protein [Longimicrobiaceae bacterium]|nr:chromate resistance protein ChrB domain-containing protein [Longimicrobiaceae bacterium]